MKENISYTGEQDTLPEEQTNVAPDTSTQEPVDTIGSEPQQEVDYLGMSDEEFLNGNVEQPTNYQEPTQEQPKEEPQPEQPKEVTESLGSEAEKDEPLTAEEFQRLVTAEFTANGRQVRVENPEDVIRLMQMGMNYNKKMEVIKPNMGLIRTLRDNGIVEPSQLQFLLDLQKGDKAAIAKLLKDKEVDSYDLSDLEETPYVPKTEIVSTSQANFDEVLADIRTMPQGTELLQSIGNTWDDTSLEFLQSNPEAMYLVYKDKQSGMYDEVMRTIDVDKTMGRIPPEWQAKPFVELYEFVATELSKQTAPVQEQQPQANIQAAPKVVGHNLQNPNQVVKTSAAPKSASINNTGSSQNILTEVPDFLAMSDEQFEAFAKSTQGLRFN